MENPLFETREQFFTMVDSFKEFFQSRRADTIHFCLYALLRGKDWRDGLAPNTNEELVKQLHHRLAKSDPKYLPLSSFKGVTAEHIEKLRAQEIPQWPK